MKLDVKNMTVAELETALATVVENMAQVNSHLDFAKSEASSTGVYRDREWFCKAKHAKRMLGIEHQALLQELGYRRKEARKTANRSLERAFIDIAKEKLPRETFWEIMDAAEAAQKETTK